VDASFDNVDHAKMEQCLRERISDPNMLVLIRRFLKAGVMTETKHVEASDRGTPQGGIISPVLANVYLHFCLDLWFTNRESKKLKGYAQMVRYADDFVHWRTAQA
jgi:RNA-directed DNA polymerase